MPASTGAPALCIRYDYRNQTRKMNKSSAMSKKFIITKFRQKCHQDKPHYIDVASGKKLEFLLFCFDTKKITCEGKKIWNKRINWLSFNVFSFFLAETMALLGVFWCINYISGRKRIFMWTRNGNFLFFARISLTTINHGIKGQLISEWLFVF